MRDKLQYHKRWPWEKKNENGALPIDLHILCAWGIIKELHFVKLLKMKTSSFKSDYP